VRGVLDAWGEVTVVGPLGGGNRNSVLELLLDGRRVVARESRRPAASLDWELDLLDHLSGHGVRVPAAVRARDGRRHVAGVVVQTWLDGDPPGPRDWLQVAAALRRVHEVTQGRPQRPGFASTRDLLTAERGGDVDLTLMPADAVAAVRAAWADLAATSPAEAVVHGDPGPANIRVTPAGAGLLDWDEARVDATDLDLAELPGRHLPRERLAAARTAATAWEAANGWSVEPSYARRQLELLCRGEHPFR
jgi:Ser/Thr protein kinase RdoA (MazF antagonist)